MSAATQHGYVSATAKPSIASRARRSPLLFVGATLFIIILVVLITQSRPSDFRALSIDNSTPEGTRALAQILRDQGATVRQVSLLSDAHIVDPDSTTLVIADPDYLLPTQTASIAQYPGDVVFLGVTQAVVESVDASLFVGAGAPDTTVTAHCSDPDATAAEQVRTGFEGIGADPGATAVRCFTDDSGMSAFAKVETSNGTRTFLANTAIVTNDQLDDLGHAALALRTVGHRDSVTWYLGSYTDSSLLTWGGGGDAPSDIEVNPAFMPSGTTEVLFALGLAVLVAALWRARRFGPLATEPLPVIVRSSEVTRGRARLYRRARATGRSAAALRGHAALRIGGRLGVPRAAGRAGLVPAVARATGRPAHEVDALLYGPPPATEATMIHLLHQLDILESEVHRP